MDIVNNHNKWVVTQDTIEIQNTNNSIGTSFTLATAGTFLDKDIQIEAPVAHVDTGSIKADEPEITQNGSAQMKEHGFLTAPSSNYYVSLSTIPGAVKSKASVIGSGYINKGITAESASVGVPVSGGGGILYIQEGSATVNDPEVSSGSAEMELHNISAAASSTQHYISLTTTAGEAKSKATISEGYVLGDSLKSSTSKTVPVSGNGETIYLKDIIFSNTSTKNLNYTDISAIAPVLITDDYLYINEGYISNSKIKLSRLVPDDATLTASTGSNFILDSQSAYDNDGKLIIGTIKTYSGEYSVS